MFDWRLWRPYRPNSFLFIPARLQLWLFPWFYKHNAPYIDKKFRFQSVQVTEKAQQVLHSIKTHLQSLIVINHASYMDPHILIETFRRTSQIKPYWMTSIDSIESNRGFNSWYLSLVGCFSVDRGVLDKRSLQYAQSGLDSGIPLVVFPEGEADYNQKVLRPFYAGASLMAINSAITNQEKGITRQVQITPLVIQTRLLENIEATWTAAVEALNEQVSGEIIPIDTPANEKLTWVIQSAINKLAQAENIALPEAPLIKQLKHLRIQLLKTMVLEHLTDKKIEDYESMGFQAVMDLKNQLRSLIARKCNVPLPKDTQTLEAGIQKLEKQIHPNLLTKLEKQFIGMATPKDVNEKRLQRLKDQLKLYQSHQALYLAASPSDHERWKEQMNQCRQAKLLFLIEEDIARGHLAPNTTWEALDETLVKLEIMSLSQFNYRGKKQLIVDAADVVNVSEFITQHTDKPKKQQLGLLNQGLYDSIEAVMRGYSHLGLPIESPLKHKVEKEFIKT